MYFYIHIPFCSSKCKYCSFSSFAKVKEDIRSKYILSLIQEIDEFFVSHPNTQIESIYFGGGTPSCLKIEELTDILNTFKKYAETDKAEITFESNPQDITDEYLDAIHNLGINRLSIGIQSLHDKTLLEIGRCNSETIFKALECIKNSRFTNVGGDFIIGLPYSGESGTARDVSELLSEYDFFKHISIYLLEEGKYPLSWKESSINEDQFLHEYLLVSDVLEKANFGRYEISNYSKKGFECRHNSAYWSHKEYVGFGLSASSFIANKRRTNASDFNNYFCRKGIFEENIGRRELELEEMMFGIRTSGIDSGRVQNKNVIQELEKEGYIKIEDKKIKLKPSGILLADFILSKLI